MGSVGCIFLFFSLDDLKMSLFLYKLGIKLLQVSDVQWDLHSVDYNVCVFYVVYLKTIRIFVNLGLWAVMC